MLYDLARRLLFLLPPEAAHTASLHAWRLVCRGISLRAAPMPLAPRRVMGLEFPNPVGLAAGLDKNADFIAALAAFGFGFIEVGTVTPRPQPGNPKPRLFRLPAEQALINRMGFNNRGVDYLVERVKRSSFKGVLGINIGKNAATPLDQASADYRLCLRNVYPYAGYVAINISSPNTPGLRDLQHGAALEKLLEALKTEQALLAKEYNRYVPLAVKIAPDLNETDIAWLAQRLTRHQIDAVIATNTTASRDGVEGSPYAAEVGGLSGKPLFERSTAVLRQLAEHLEGRLPIIAAGGILSATDAKAKQEAGASLVQLYTGLIYRGPRLVREVAQALR